MKRRAASPLVAELCLIFVTIIVAVPLGGLVWGLMSNYTKTADVSVNFVACGGYNATSTYCTLNLDNVGTGSAVLKPSSYLLVFYGQSTESVYSNTCEGTSGDLIPGGSSLVVNCVFGIPAGAPGARFTGWVSLVSGQDLPFAGSF